MGRFALMGMVASMEAEVPRSRHRADRYAVKLRDEVVVRSRGHPKSLRVVAQLKRQAAALDIIL